MMIIDDDNQVMWMRMLLAVHAGPLHRILPSPCVPAEYPYASNCCEMGKLTNPMLPYNIRCATKVF
jgi:hypothetical protein